MQNILTKATSILSKNIIRNPRLEAELLLAHVFKLDINHVRLGIFPPIIEENGPNLALFWQLIFQKAKNYPTAYLMSSKEFYGYDFFVNKNVLIPRPDSEILIEYLCKNVATKTLYTKQPRLRNILELATGSGALAITLSHELKRICPTNTIKYYATDISQKALQIANINKQRHLTTQIYLLKSNWWQNIPRKKFDLIIANPPYIEPRNQQKLQANLAYEPNLALWNTGLSAYRIILRKAYKYLADNAILALEFGDFSQLKELKKLGLSHKLKHIETKKDLANNLRVIIFRKA